MSSFWGIFVQIENSSCHRGDLTNNNSIGYPVFGGYKEILELDVTILPCILLKEIQYYINDICWVLNCLNLKKSLYKRYQRLLCCEQAWTLPSMGLFTRERITFRKTFRNVIRPFPDLKAWFYPLWTQNSFKSGFWNTKKGAFWIVIRVESLILGHVNAKLFLNVIRACAFWKCALKPCMGQSARTAQWEQNITSQCADPDRDWDGVCDACERT